MTKGRQLVDYLVGVFSNKLVWIFLLVGSAYWIVEPFFNQNKIVDVQMVIHLVLMIAVTGTYAGAALDALREGETGGQAQWLAGICIFGIGNIGIAVWSLYMSSQGYPDHLFSHPLRGFIHLSRIFGELLLVTAAISEKANPRLAGVRTVVMIVAAIVGALVAGIYFGAAWSGEEKKADVQREVISPDACAVIGNKRTKVYHDRSSPFRPMLRGGICFQRVAEAEAAGYRAARFSNVH